MIELRKVSKTYPPEHKALDLVTLSIPEGSFTCVAGASGAGKSTLLKVLFGEEKPTSGEALIAGRNMSVLTPRSRALFRRDVGFVFQDYKLLPEKTVLENVTFPLEVQGVKKSVREEIGLELLRMAQLSDRLTSFPRMLSGGEQQRVAVLRALIHRPKLILADEPTGNLDPKMTDLVFQLLLQANDVGITVVVVSHDLAMIEQLKKRTLVIDKGRIISDFTP